MKFLKTKKDLFALVVIAILALAVIATSQSSQDQANKYIKIINDTETYYNTTITNIRDNMTVMNQTITDLNVQLYIDQTIISSLENQTTSLTENNTNLITNNSNLAFKIENYLNFVNQTGHASHNYSKAQVNDTLGIYLFNKANESYNTNNASLDAKSSCGLVKTYLANARSNYNSSKTFYSNILYFTDTNQLITLYVNLINTDLSMMQYMTSAANYMTSSIDYNIALDYVNGNAQFTLMKGAVNSYNSLKTTRNSYLTQIQTLLNNM